MAELPDLDRKQIWAHLMRQAGGFPGDVGKPDLRSAVNAVDAWIEDNQGSFNTALPNPFKTSASQAQKTLMFCYVAMRRAGLLHVKGD